MSCGICLSKLKEPVSVPCGHVYCTGCLTGHVSATSPDGFTSTCPSCREPFNMVRPELTCLPKKFHQYIVPSLRRLYIDADSSTDSVRSLRKKLALSEARAHSLEEDKERLMKECERHIAAAQAHSRGETKALRRAKAAEEQLSEWEDAASRGAEMAEAALAEAREAEERREEAQEAMRAMKIKYDKMKRHVRGLRREEEPDTLPLVGKRTSALIDLSLDEAPLSPKRLRVIRPLPRSSRQSLPTTMITPTNPPRWRHLRDSSPPLPLGSPFHT